MRIRLFVVLELSIALLLCGMSYGQARGGFTEPNSILLFGDHKLWLVTPQETVEIQDPPGFLETGYSSLPALAPGADRIAWTFVVRGEGGQGKYESALGVYSLVDKSWRLYGDFCESDHGSVAFSPDGTRIGFTSKSGPSEPDCSHHSSLLQILDIATGMLATIGYPASQLMSNARLSWSPDGKYLVGQTDEWRLSPPIGPSPHIVLIEVASGVGKVIAEGRDPSWSPKGDWIAFMDGPKCMLIRPDGTGAKVVRVLGRGFPGYGGMPMYGVVWSPDGTEMLFNEEDDDGRVTIAQLDLLSGKVTKRSRSGLAVFGWSSKSGD